MKVAVLGTGIMGTATSRTMLAAELEVRAWNRTRAKAEPLAADGATVAETAADAVLGADVAITFLHDADAVVEVARDVVGELADTVWLQMSTIGIEGTRRVADLAEKHGLAVLDAPVLGTKGPAEQGKLVPLVSGDPDLVERARPVLDVIGAKTVVAGPELGQGTALKLICNAWIASMITALGQSHALAEGLGLDPSLFLEGIGGSAVDAPYAHVKSGLMKGRDYPPSFSIDNVLKDLGLIIDASAVAGIPDGLLAAQRQLFADASANGFGGDDMAAIREAFRNPAAE